jgi:hypothetical protein
MDHFAGLDVSVRVTSVCIVDDAGKIVREVKVASEPEAIAQMMRVGLYRPVHGPALTQGINLTAILVCYSPVLPHRQPLATSRGYGLARFLSRRADDLCSRSIRSRSGATTLCTSSTTILGMTRVKFRALVFIVFVPSQYATRIQLSNA